MVSQGQEENPFLKLDADELHRAAQQHEFRRARERNWVRRTGDLVQLVNLQKSHWDSGDHYLNFALWPLAFGDPPSLAESRFHFRTRAERLGAGDLATFFEVANRLTTLDSLRAALVSRWVVGLVTRQLQDLLGMES